MLFGIGFVPSAVPHGFVTVPIAFLVGTQIGLFRSVGDLGYLPVATTGNSLRLVETGYSTLVDDVRAISVSAALIAVAGVLFVFEKRSTSRGADVSVA